MKRTPEQRESCGKGVGEERGVQGYDSRSTGCQQNQASVCRAGVGLGACAEDPQLWLLEHKFWLGSRGRRPGWGLVQHPSGEQRGPRSGR